MAESERVPSVPGPLSGIRVLDATARLSGPFATMLMADLGATVIKIEPPKAGEPTRSVAPMVGSQSAYFVSINRGKKSVALDFRTDRGREIFLRLAEQSDVLIENYMPGTLEKHRLGYNDVAARNSRIIYASISGFGQTGPDRTLPAFDIIAQAVSGFLSITGYPDQPPARAGVSLGDLASGLFATIGITSAVIERAASGVGQYLDVSMLDSQVALMENAFTRYLMAGDSPLPVGSRHPLMTPFQALPTVDGHIVVSLRSDGQWAAFCEAIGLDAIYSDERFATNALRTEHHAVLEPILTEATKNLSIEDCITRLRVRDIPCAQVNSVAQAAALEQLKVRQMFVEGSQPGAGRWVYVNSPLKFSRTPAGPQGAAPALGEHTRDVLGSMLGYSPEELDSLAAEGTIR